MSGATSQTEEIVVIVKPACVQCEATYKQLNKDNREYEIVDIYKDPAASYFVMSLGYLQLPVVIVGRIGRPDKHWSGFRPDRIKNISNPNALYTVSAA